MNALIAFRPALRQGLLFQAIFAVVLASGSLLAFLSGWNQPIGASFVLLLIVSLGLFAPLLLVLYRAYALTRASYYLERDGLRLRWGLRAEDIPLPEIEWVRRASDLAVVLPPPPFSWPGAMLGTVHTQDLGIVEYMASSRDHLLLIATPERIYAISPDDPAAFLKAFQRTFELGSLSPISSVSVLPAAYLARIWADLPVRYMLLAGFVVGLLLLVIVSLAIPGRETIPLGFQSDGSPLPGVPAGQLILLPMLAAFIFFGDFFAGLFFYRNDAHRPVAYIVWGSGMVTMLLLLSAALMLIQIP
jgi:hypothetical protein